MGVYGLAKCLEATATLPHSTCHSGVLSALHEIIVCEGPRHDPKAQLGRWGEGRSRWVKEKRWLCVWVADSGQQTVGRRQERRAQAFSVRGDTQLPLVGTLVVAMTMHHTRR